MIRDNSASIRLASGGMWAYLYDQSHTETVRDALEAVPENGAESRKVLDLARRGVLVTCELRDETPLDWEIAVGDPLSPGEKKIAKWMRIVRVPLDVPSGRLVIATEATRIAVAGGVPATVPLAPGTYELALHMVNRDNMTEPRYAAYDGPHAVLTLRPWPQKRTYRPRTGAIFYARDAQSAGGPRAPWDGRYHVDHNGFRGEVIATSDSLQGSWSGHDERRMICNLEAHAFRTLDLRRGQRLSVHVGGQTYTVLSLGRWHPTGAEQFLGKRAFAALASLHPRLLVGFLSGTRTIVEPEFLVRYHEDDIPYRWHNYFVIRTITPDSEGSRTDDPACNTIFQVPPGTAVEVRVEPEPFFDLDLSLREAWTVAGDVLHAKVVSCAEAALFLSVDHRPLAKIGFQDGDTLALRLGDVVRTVYDKTYLTSRDWIAMLERITRPLPGGQATRAAELEAVIYDESGHMRPEDELPARADLLRELYRLTYHPDDLAAPPLALSFIENKDVDGWTMIVLKSAFWESFYDPDEIHLAAAPGASVTLRKIP